ncbi:MAG: OmpA family protein [Prevotella sp.]|nr:OmpA family protein [Prevotella sp.]
MKIKTLLVACLAFVSLSAMAQKQQKVVDRIDQRTVQELDHTDVTTQFKPYWYLDLQGGAQWTIGEAKFKDLLSPNVQLGLGYQFSKVVGARLAFNGWQSKGGFDNLEIKKYKWKYVAGGLDVTFNISNLVAGWNPKRLFNFSLFVGGGANMAFSNDEANDLAAQGYTMQYLWDGTKFRPYFRGGAQAMFRLSDCVNLLFEGSFNGLSDKYNSKYGDNIDKYVNALVGLRINLGKTYKEESHEVYRDVVVTDTIYKYVTIEEPKPAKVEPMRREVFFVINKYDIRDTEVGKIKDVADYLNANKDAKVNIVGYADAGTGNDRINDRLAKQRADAVVKCLLEKYEIAADRISYDSKGAHEQPFAENDKNRVTIMIAE